MKSCLKIPLTAGQAVTVHGWFRPKETLSWTDVLGNQDLTMQYLNKTIRIPLSLLHKMQPDITAWIKSGRASMEEAPVFLSVWAAHPIKDLKADLGDIVGFKWKAKTMRESGVTYSDLMEAGMTHETMALFNYTLYEWMLLGFSKTDAEAVPAHILGRLFNMTKPDVLRVLK